MNTNVIFTREPIVVPAMSLPSREIGACLEFQGIVREMENGAMLQGIEYGAYEPMARTILHRHFAELNSQYACDSVYFIHRLGWVPVGEASLFVRVLSAHRGEALKFMADAIDRLKKDVPIWKLAPAAS